NRILSELQTHGISGEALNDIKSNLTQDEASRAREVRRKKFPHPPIDAAERAKQMRFLQQRGFSNRAIQSAMRPVDDSEEEQ
ncbi:MAG TPA: regulatory protein RecX, partial [Noviherbaspirillum sp.]|nr:regulatory protein RecX [Noviherbaspirillum sp.]